MRKKEEKVGEERGGGREERGGERREERGGREGGRREEEGKYTPSTNLWSHSKLISSGMGMRPSLTWSKLAGHVLGSLPAGLYFPAITMASASPAL